MSKSKEHEIARDDCEALLAIEAEIERLADLAGQTERTLQRVRLDLADKTADKQNCMRAILRRMQQSPDRQGFRIDLNTGSVELVAIDAPKR